MFLIAALVVLLILDSPWNLIVSGACLVGFAGEVAFWNMTVRGKRKRVGAEALIDAEGTVLTIDQGDGAIGPACRAELDRLAPLR